VVKVQIVAELFYGNGTTQATIATEADLGGNGESTQYGC
jgi:hypothetical protein